MMLKFKNAIIYGGAGSLGSTIAKSFAAAGARVFLTGRNAGALKKVADQIISAGGDAEFKVVDALDENAINTYLKTIVDSIKTIDISFNATSSDDVQDQPLVNMSADDYMSPVNKMGRTFFLTAKAAGNIMKQQGSGVILSLTATPGGIGYPYTGGFAAGCAVVESLSKNLAAELGVFGVRAVNIRSGGSPDSQVFKTAIEQFPDVMKTVLGSMEADTMLKRLPRMEEIANLAVFLCSDLARNITGVTVDITGGTTAALNYRAVTDKG